MKGLTDATAALDRGLSSLDQDMAFLLHVTPVNVAEACRAFAASAAPEPDFEYRPLPFDVAEAEAKLAGLPEADGSVWARLLEAKREELAVRLRMLRERDTPAFRELGELLYGTVEPVLLEMAEELLAAIDPRAAAARSGGVAAGEIAAHAAEEVAAYGFDCRIEVRDDVTGLVVEHGQLLVGRDTVLPPERVRALLHHEVGTHVLTHVNGGRQPVHLLADGVAGYEELQEALGVLAEYLAGGLSPLRLRRLAERVVAVASLEAGASFRDTWELLQTRWGLAPGAAFTVAMRVHRSGGLAKDVVYLRGLWSLLDHLAAGGGFDVLFVGKISLRDVATVKRLLDDGRLADDWVLPRYLDEPAAVARFDSLRAGCDVLDLLNGGAS